MEKPTIVEKFADNGEHSHYALIETETGELLWSEDPEEEMQQVKNLNIPAVSGRSELLESFIDFINKRHFNNFRLTKDEVETFLDSNCH